MPAGEESATATTQISWEWGSRSPRGSGTCATEGLEASAHFHQWTQQISLPYATLPYLLLHPITALSPAPERTVVARRCGRTP